MRLFLTYVDYGEWTEHFYVIANDREDAIKKIHRERFSNITGMKDVSRQKKQIRDNLKEAPGDVDWYIENKRS